MKNLINILIFLFPFLIFSQQNKVKLGIDVAVLDSASVLVGKRLALFTNQSGVDSRGIPTAEILAGDDRFDLKKIFVPEHGYYTTIPAGKPIKNDSLNNIPLVSLYGSLKIPNSDILKNIDAIVVDIQDIGIRSYTYISSLLYLMQGAANHNTEVIILDRPNPLGGLIVDGNTPEPKYKSFVSLVPTTYLHGCTIAEIALMINGELWTENKKSCELKVIPMEGWERWMSWEDTGLNWVPTSPHIPTVNAVRGAAVTGIFGELGIMSIGIGTTSPFRYIGSPYIELEELNNDYEGIYLQQTKFRPFYGMYSGKNVDGFYLKFFLTNDLKPYTTGIMIFKDILKKNPDLLNKDKIKKRSKEMFQKVTGTDKILKSLQNGDSKEKLEKLTSVGVIDFLNIRNKYLLYK